MGAIASQITSLTIVYSIVYSDVNQRKHQSSASLAFVRGIHRGPVNSPHKWPVTRKMFPFDDVIMTTSCNGLLPGGTKPFPDHCWPAMLTCSLASNFTRSAHEFLFDIRRIHVLKWIYHFPRANVLIKCIYLTSFQITQIYLSKYFAFQLPVGSCVLQSSSGSDDTICVYGGVHGRNYIVWILGWHVSDMPIESK